MKILNIGSMNLDFVYSVDHIVTTGETEASTSLDIFLGGKGMNQSVAAAKAGAEIYHAGLIGEDGKIFIDACKQHNVNCKYIETTEGKTGHAIIQRDKNGQNCILLFGGANRKLTKDFIDNVIADFSEGDILMLQNEVNMLSYIVDCAHHKKLQIALNPSPFNECLADVDAGKINYLILNEIEGEQMTGQAKPEAIIEKLLAMYPSIKIVLTLGENGAIYADKNSIHYQPAYKVTAVDTTAAGDTFTGYFLACISENMDVPLSLEFAAKAAAIAVTREGAVPSIPLKEEVTLFLNR
ncbi:MAG: ribokinase [Ruminococcaceae bacterium]|nr:ribokinase [Oscillospiraceae bacterium]